MYAHHHPLAGLVYIIYGIIILSGGIYGYVKTNSRPSLISGIISAIVAAIAAAVFHRHPQLGVAIGGLLGLSLAIVFYIRYSNTKKTMPAIPIGALSLFVFFYSIFALMRIHHLMHIHKY
jgi:uncharacterized membrane protein (UPF0136 family)